MSAAPSSHNSSTPAPRSARSPAVPAPPGFPTGVQVVTLGRRGSRRRVGGVPQLPRARRRAGLGGASRAAGRSHASRRALGDQRRRRLLPAAVALSRRPQPGGRAARRRLRPGVGEPAPNGVRHQLLRHVGTPDSGGRRGRGPYAAASTAPIVDRDISAVAAHALLTDELVGQKIPLTGPQALTNTELVDVIGGVLGRRLRYQRDPGGTRAATLRRHGFSGRVRRRLHRASGGDGREARVGDPRRGEDPRPSRRVVRRRGVGPPTTCSRITKGDNHV